MTRKLKDDEFLITNQTIKNEDTLVTKNEIYRQLAQQVNSKLVGVPLKLQIYNLAQRQPEKEFINWVDKKPKREKRLVSLLSKKQVVQLKKTWVGINNSIKNTGEPPAIFSESSTENSLRKIESWYWNHGWFNAKANYEIQKDTTNQKIEIQYSVEPGALYTIDSISENIASPAADSLYQLIKAENQIKLGKAYNTEEFNTDRDNISRFFRNHGLFHFEKENISFYADTINNNQRINLELNIQNRVIDNRDSLQTEPFKVHKISEVNVFSDYDGSTTKVEDSVRYKNYNIYSLQQ